MDILATIGRQASEHYQGSRRVLSFEEYLELVREHPDWHLRNAARYLLDAILHFGSEDRKTPRGEQRRYTLFDAPFDAGRGRLLGQEAVQEAVVRLLGNSVRQGRVDRFILLHGPNGSAKSTFTEMLSRGLEAYSILDEGALYRFNWIFPSVRSGRGGIGFGKEDSPERRAGTFAHLDESEVDARLPCEMHDHPLLLVPRLIRQSLFKEILGSEEAVKTVPDYLRSGDLCPKCRMVYEALLSTYEGDYLRLLQHVQVERFYVSRRYRRASARVEPAMAVDAIMRQVTADRSLGALPTALQNVNLFVADGDLVQGNRGVVDFTDLLKRPLEAFKYLLTAVEEGHIVLERANLFFDVVFVGSSNDGHVAAFKESHEWTSFKGRMELVRVPYLLVYREEQRIYDEQVRPEQVGKHIAPHATAVAALWAVLTRLLPPDEKRYAETLRPVVKRLTPLEKAELYDNGRLPAGVRGEEAKLLKNAIPDLYHETDAEALYEGRIGASPREIKSLILNAAQDPRFRCLSVEAVFSQLRALVQETSVYAYLRMEPQDGYHDHPGFIDVVRRWYLGHVDDEVRQASGLVEEKSHLELFGRYLTQVTHALRRETLYNPVTRAHEPPDQTLMARVEEDLGVGTNPDEFRQGLITRVGAWSVDHTGEKPDLAAIFPEHVETLRTAYFQRQQQRLRRLLTHVLRVLDSEAGSLSVEEQRQAASVVQRLKDLFGYCEACAREVIGTLLKERYPD